MLQVITSSLLVLLTVLQFLLAWYILLLNPRSNTNRAMAGLLFLFSLVTLASEILRSTFTNQEANIWLIIRSIGVLSIGPSVYLTSVLILRPEWIKKYRIIYLPVIAYLFLPLIFIILDVLGVSQLFFGQPLIFSPPSEKLFAGEMLGREINQGLLGEIFFWGQIIFPSLSIICPDLVVAWRDRKTAPNVRKMALALLVATSIAGSVQMLSPEWGVSSTNAIAGFFFLLVLGYVILRLSDFQAQTRQFQTTFGRWSVYTKLVASIIIVNIVTVFTVAVTTLTILRVNTVQTAGANLNLLANSVAQNVANEMVLETARLEELAQTDIIVSTVDLQNRLNTDIPPDELALTLQENELNWQTSNVAFQNTYIERYSAATEVLLEFKDVFSEHTNLYILDELGTIVSATAPPDRFSSIQTNWWQATYNKALGNVFISAPLYDAENNLYYIEMAVPVYLNNEAIGVIFSRYNPSTIITEIDEIQIGVSGKASLINSIGLLIPKNLNEPPVDLDLNWIQLESSSVPWQITSLQNQDRLISWVKLADLASDGPITNLQWRLLVNQSTQEVFGSVTLIRSASIFALNGTILLSIVLALFISRIITYPLAELTQKTSLVSKGQLGIRAEELTSDEFGTLAKSFNIMTGQLQTLIVGLEHQVAERTQDLQRRALQLQTAAEVGSAMASIRNLDELLQQVTFLIGERFGFYHVAIFLLSEDKAYAELKAANSAGGQQLLIKNLRLKVGEVGIVGFVAASQQPRIANDVGEDAAFFNTPDLPETHSEMALPLISAGKILGVLDVQSTQYAAFSQEDVSILQILADQLSIAIENANLFTANQKALGEVQSSLETARRAYRDLSREGWRDIQRESTSYAFRATSQGVIPIRSDPTPDLTRIAHSGHLTLPEPATLAIPIKIQDHVIGVIRLKKETDKSWGPNEVDLAENLTKQLSSALEGARLYKETQTSLVRTEALYQVGRAAIAYEKINDILQSVADTIAETLPAHRVLIVTLDTKSQRVLHFVENGPVVQEITPEIYHQLMQGLTGWAIQARKPAISPKNLPDQRESPDAQKHRVENDIGSVVVVPMFYQDEPLGTITVINTGEQRDFSREDVDLLTAMANQLAGAVTNVQLLVQTQRRALQLQTSAEVSRVSSLILELENLLPEAVELIRDRFALYYVGLFLLDDTRQWAELRAGTGEAGRIQLENKHRLAVGGESMIGQCVATNRARIALDVGIEATRFQNPHLPNTRSEMALPLTSRGDTIGALTIQSEWPSAFSQEDIIVFQTMADQLASTIENAILFESNRQRLQISSTLLEITQVAASTIHMTPMLREITQRTAKVMNAYRCMIYLLDDDNVIQPVMAQFADGHEDKKQWELFKSITSDRLENLPLFNRAIRERTPILVTQVQNRPDLVPLDWVKPFYQQTVLAVPLISQNQGIGIMLLDQISPRHSFNQEQIDLALTIAGQTSAIIQNARLFQQQSQRAEELRLLNQISIELSQQQTDLKPALETLNQKALELFNVDGSGVWLWDTEKQELELVVTIQVGDTNLHGRRLKPGEGLSGKAFLTKQLQVVDDYLTWDDRPRNFDDVPFHAALAIPLIQQNEVLGVLTITRSQPGLTFTADQKNLAILFSGQVAAFIRNAILLEQTQEALRREKRESQIASSLANAAEKLSSAHGESEIRHVMAEEIKNVILPDQLILYEWKDLHSAFQVDICLNMEGDDVDSIYPIGKLIIPEHRPDLWDVFSTDQPFYAIQEKPGNLLQEQYIISWASGSIPAGVIELYHTARFAHIREQDREAIQGIIRQASVAIQSARLFEQTQEALTRTEALYQVSQASAAVENLGILLQSIVDRIAESLPADRVLLLTLDLDNRQVTSFVESGLPTGSIVPLTYDELMNGLTGWVIHERKPTLSLKNRPDERESKEVRQHRIDAGAGSILVVPIIYREHILGTLTATNDLDSPDFTEQDLNLLQAMSNQAAAAIENARLFNQTQYRAVQLQTAAEVSRAAASILDLELLLPQMVELISTRFNLYYVGIFLVDEIRRYAVLRAGSGEAGRLQVEQGHRLRLTPDSMIGRCVLENSAQIAQDIGDETVFFRNPLLPETRSEMALPLIASGQTIGAMTIQSIQPSAFSSEDITVLQTLADQLAIAIENARYIAETRIRAENEQMLNQISVSLLNSLDLDAVLQTAVREIGQIPHIREVAIHLGEMEPLNQNGEEDFTDSEHGFQPVTQSSSPHQE